MQCPTSDDLERLAIGAISDEAAGPIEWHLLECTTCVQRLAAVAASDTLLDALREQSTMQESPTEMSDELRRLVSRLALTPSKLPLQLELTGSPQAERSAETASVAPVSFAFLAPAEAPDEIGRLGGYRVLRVLGAGGMGVVFEAEDPRLKRRVALKMMKPDLAAHAQSRQRFLREAQAMAALDHDHVVTVHQVGEAGVPFLAMQLLHGENLDTRLKRETKLQPDEVLRIGLEVADGLAAAHARGLIHRDIKPGNIWLETGRGRPRVKILDFGLARASEGTENLTRSTAILGTPSYMAPEQARGEAIDARADLFSLGCVLYRMATGETAFKGNSPLTVLTSIALATPPAPREVNSDVPAELSDLIVSLLSKDPARRRKSAREVMDALHSMVNCRSAKPPRRRGLAVFAMAAAAATLLAGVVIVIKNREGSVIATVKTDSSAEVEAAGNITLEVQPADENGESAPTAKPAGGRSIDSVAPQPTNGFQPPLGPLALVQRAAKLPGVESWSLEPMARESMYTGRQPALAFSPDGSLLAVGGDDEHLRVYSPLSGKAPRLVKLLMGHNSRVVAIAWSSNGKLIASAESGQPNIRIWEAATGKLVSSAVVGLASVNCLAWSPDLQVLAVGGSSGVLLLEPTSGELLPELTSGLGNAILALCWSPDGCKFAAADHDRLQIWDAATGSVEHKLAHPQGERSAGSLAWSGDGKSLAFGGPLSNVVVWNVEDGSLRATLRVQATQQGLLSWLDKDSRLGLNTDAGWQEWDVERGKCIADCPPSNPQLARSADGRVVADVGSSGDFGVIDIRTGTRRTIDRRSSTSRISWSPDGRTLATGGAACLNVWHINHPQRLEGLPPVAVNGCTVLASLFNGDSIFDGHGNTFSGIGSRDTKGWAWTRLDAGPSVGDVSPDGSKLVCAYHQEDHVPHLWSLATGKSLGDLQPHSGVINVVAWAPDSRRLACATSGGALGIWDSDDGTHIEGRETGAPISVLSWSPDGKLLAASAENDALRIYDDRLHLDRELAVHQGAAAMTWSDDSQVLLTADAHAVRRWEISTGQLTSTIRHGLPTRAESSNWRFSPRNDRFVTTGSAARILSTTTGEIEAALVPLPKGRAAVIDIYGQYLASIPLAENDLVYVVQTADGQDLLSPKEFADKYGWRNDPSKVKLP